MSDIKTYDNIMPLSLLDDINAYISDNVFYKHFPHTVDANSNLIFDNCKDVNMFGANFYNTTHSGVWEYRYEVYESIKYYMPEVFDGYNLQRMQVNILTPQIDFPNGYWNIPHIDAPLPKTKSEYKTVIFYLKDSDGDTILFDKFAEDSNFFHNNVIVKKQKIKLNVAHKQTPIKNTALVFNSYRLHTSTPPMKTNYRTVINIVLEK